MDGNARDGAAGPRAPGPGYRGKKSESARSRGSRKLSPHRAPRLRPGPHMRAAEAGGAGAQGGGRLGGPGDWDPPLVPSYPADPGQQVVGAGSAQVPGEAESSPRGTPGHRSRGGGGPLSAQPLCRLLSARLARPTSDPTLSNVSNSV